MHSMVHYIGGGALAGARSSGPEHVRLQPTLRTVAGHITYGCSPEYVRLQPTLGTVAAHIIYGCSPQYVRLQAHADFETAIALDPTHPDIYCHRGQLYMLQNELGKAIGDLRKVPPPATCLLPPASRLPPPASCLLPPASCFLPPASCLLPPASPVLLFFGFPRVRAFFSRPLWG